jgi:hypothetical protein
MEPEDEDETKMTKRILSLLAVALVASAAACNGDADDDVVSQDTTLSTIPSADTVDLPTVVPTQDTVLQTTTTTVDTIEGDAVTTDTVVRP